MFANCQTAICKQKLQSSHSAVPELQTSSTNDVFLFCAMMAHKSCCIPAVTVCVVSQLLGYKVGEMQQACLAIDIWRDESAGLVV